MKRRIFIRSIAGLAALAAAPALARAKPAPFPLADFAEVTPSGLIIRNKVFRLAQPAVLALGDVKHASIVDCMFQWIGGAGGLGDDAMLTLQGGNLLIERCVFDGNWTGGPAIRLLPTEQRMGRRRT